MLQNRQSRALIFRAVSIFSFIKPKHQDLLLVRLIFSSIIPYDVHLSMRIQERRSRHLDSPESTPWEVSIPNTDHKPAGAIRLSQSYVDKIANSQHKSSEIWWILSLCETDSALLIILHTLQNRSELEFIIFFWNWSYLRATHQTPQISGKFEGRNSPNFREIWGSGKLEDKKILKFEDKKSSNFSQKVLKFEDKKSSNLSQKILKFQPLFWKKWLGFQDKSGWNSSHFWAQIWGLFGWNLRTFCPQIWGFFSFDLRIFPSIWGFFFSVWEFIFPLNLRIFPLKFPGCSQITPIPEEYNKLKKNSRENETQSRTNEPQRW